jgi:hypothetical protein
MARRFAGGEFIVVKSNPDGVAPAAMGNEETPISNFG